ncbi:MAG: SDR family oxidoreductase [SAR202 cluster bacterium]|jgi:NAD(P)-dependent dehydrogenase (short-subunit alcohol dehydrogenase family)|nr:MAG: SDR family oxidoreductase [SAR202 cluster bacterium]KAA1306294.1 MAG: SDR family oxidoreductase [SAR202 cluster bacterium]
MFDLSDRVAIVTGGAQGVGGGISRILARAGAKVLIADIDIDMARNTEELIRKNSGIAESLKIDVTSYEDLKNMVEVANDHWGRLDILINNAYAAADGQQGGALEVTEERWESDIRALVTSVYAGSKYAIPLMQKTGGGSIVNISSVHGFLVAKKALTYETGKAAVIAMTKQMAVDYGSSGIRVNAICPGHIVTERIMETVWKNNPSGLKFFEDQYPVGRTGVPEDIGNAATFLCSDEASFITGHALPVDGGLTIQLQENFGVQQVHYYMDNADTEMPYKR